MGKFLKMYNLQRLNQEEIKNRTRPDISNDTEQVILKLPKKQKSRPRQLHRLILPNA